MLHIFITLIAPIIIVAGLGMLLGRVKSIDDRTLSRVVIYGLANSSITSTELGSDTKLVSSIVLLSTLLSLITLPIILFLVSSQ